MKLPEPFAGFRWNESWHSWQQVIPEAIHHDDVTRMYTEEQVKALLAQADDDFSAGMTVVHLRVADQMKRRYEPVLKMALEAFAEVAEWESEGDPEHPASKAIDAIRKALK